MINGSTMKILKGLKADMDANGGKISKGFVDAYAEKCTYTFKQVDESVRVCVLTTTNGNKIVDKAMVLDPANDVEEIGNEVAKDNCTNQLWVFLGGLAKTLA